MEDEDDEDDELPSLPRRDKRSDGVKVERERKQRGKEE
jgi:hypothetical protein